mgnify:CR=1 FL=1
MCVRRRHGRRRAVRDRISIRRDLHVGSVGSCERRKILTGDASSEDAVASSSPIRAVPRHHESVTLREFASRLAAIKAAVSRVNTIPRFATRTLCTFVPNDTLVGIDAAQRLGIRGRGFVRRCRALCIHRHEDDHPSAARCRAALTGRDGLRNSRIAFATWCFRATRRLRGAMLASPGCELELGRVRLKLPAGIGGLGQSIVDDGRCSMESSSPSMTPRCRARAWCSNRTWRTWLRTASGRYA